MASRVVLPLRCLAACAALVPSFVAAETLEESISSLISRHRLSASNVAVAVIADGGDLVVALHATEAFKPASNQKLLTTAAALHWLGTDYVFETTLKATAPLKEGRIDGDVVLCGTGDPNISGRFYGGEPTALLKTWARQLHDAGLCRIAGDLIADDRFLDAVRYSPSWDRAQEGRWYAAQVSALSLNDNCIDLTIWPGAGPGSRARVEASPYCPLVGITGAPMTVSKGRTQILVHRERDTNKISISGHIRQGSAPWKDNVTVDDPALCFAGTLAEVLKGQGITIGGKVRRYARESVEEAAPAPAKGRKEEPAPGEKPEATADAEKTGAGAGAREFLLVRHTSTLMQDLPVIHKQSQNLHAELLLRIMGARAGGEGSPRGGEAAIRRFLREKKISDGGLVVGDGCGLSHENRLSASILARVLHSVRSEPYFERYRDSLAVAGEDGTLKARFKGTPDLRGKLFGKTGYISGVSCLSGYIVKGESIWCFSILANGFPEGSRPIRDLQERICQRIHAAMP